MNKKAIALCEIVKVFEDKFSSEKSGIFSIESTAHEAANKFELKRIQEKIIKYNKGYQGSIITCPKCGKQKHYYKGDREKILSLQSGKLKVKRAYYCCKDCGYKSCPLDEKLGLVKGQEQGHLREKLSLIGVLSPYHQAPDICQVMLGDATYASSAKRLLERESDSFESEEKEEKTLDVRSEDTVYIEIDGHMCPTREPRRDSKDQGFREAKAVTVFKEDEILKVSKNRRKIQEQVLKAQVCSSSVFKNLVENVLDSEEVLSAERVVVRGDGAHWIWNISKELIPNAIEILDYSHAKSYLHEASKIIFGENSSELSCAWIKEQKKLLFEDKVEDVISGMISKSCNKPKLEHIITYLKNNVHRMKYDSFEKMGLGIGSGAIESAGKRIASGRIKGSGMRWNVKDLNKFLKLRCAFFDNSWLSYWKSQYKKAA